MAGLINNPGRRLVFFPISTQSRWVDGRRDDAASPDCISYWDAMGYLKQDRSLWGDCLYYCLVLWLQQGLRDGRG